MLDTRQYLGHATKDSFRLFYFIISFLYNKDHFQQFAIRLNVITLLMLIDKSKKT